MQANYSRSDSFLVNTGSIVTFLCEEEIRLKQGFRAMRGSTFTARVQGPQYICQLPYDSFEPSQSLAGWVEEIPAALPSGSGIRLFPNPVTDMATLLIPIDQDQKVTVSVINLQGRELLSQRHYLLNGENRAYIDVGLLPSGLYFVKVSGDNFIETLKLVKR